MGLFTRLFGAGAGPASSPETEGAGGRVLAYNGGSHFRDFDDPALGAFLRGGTGTASGINVSVEVAMRNSAVFRSVSLLSSSIAMLPLHLYRAGSERQKASDHPLFKVLYRRANTWQTAYEFRSLMQSWALLHGDAVAFKIMRGRDVIGLAPIDPSRLTISQNDDWTMRYEYQPPKGARRVFGAPEVFHLRGFSLDGIRGRSLVRQAAEAIGLALQTEQAAARLFSKGMLVGGALKMPEHRKLSPEAYDRLIASMAEREGAENAHRWILLEEGLDAEQFQATAENAQHIEQRKFQIEEIARVFGVPRPLLMVDDTSWGSGIDVLGQLFVRYGLNPWFTAWEESIQRDLLRDDEQDKFYAKFNAGALLRGSMKDQADFFAKALGSGGHYPWMHPEEVRDLSELCARDDLPAPIGGARKEAGDDPARNA